MKVKRRKKAIRYRGSRTHGRGYKNRTRGSGNRGGVGLSGTGKRGDQKKTLMIKLYGNNYFKKDKSVAKTKIHVMTLETISQNIHNLVKQGIAKEQKGGYELKLEKYKIIGSETPFALTIHARAASEGARAAVEKAGGKVVVASKE